MSLEIIIVICLASALFLLLRHYPDAKDFKFPINREKFSNFVGRFKGKRKNTVAENIAIEIEKNQEEVVSPVEIEEAVEVYKEENPETAEILFQAEKYYNENDLRTAEEKAIEAIGKNKRCSKAYIIIGDIAYSRGQFPEAKEAYKAAIKCNPSSGEAFFGLGEIEFRAENYTGAIDYLLKSVILEKGHADWYAELGKAHLEIRQFAKAAKALRRAASLDIDNKEYRELASQAEEKQRTHSIYTRHK